jgi:membrane protease YdiL (CAAX protease family)
MQFDLQFILLLLLNGLINLAFFVLAVVYFFVEAQKTTRPTGRRTVIISTLILTAALVNVFMTRYAVVFPKAGGYDLNSDFNFFTSLATAVFSFFVCICYIRCGQHFAAEREMPGSLILKTGEETKRIEWKWILILTPVLIVWTFGWFAVFPPEPTELALATTPEGDGLMVYIYTFFTASILAPVQEEILYRHFAMGLFYKWFGRSKPAIALNILVTALIFAAAHAGVVTEDWIKIIQILPAGLAFGWVNHKKGLEHSILAHSAFNTLAIPVSMLMEYIAR